MPSDKIQKQRFEYKYLVPEYLTDGIRDFIGSYLVLDGYGAMHPDLSYPVHSLYFDSPFLSTYQDTINGNRNRFKLRVRFYENAPDKPVYFEIKRRFNKVIAKKRARVLREAAPIIAAGHLPRPEHLDYVDAEQLDAIGHFSTLMNELNASPKLHVAYRREAWIGDGSNAIRVTMDRQVMTEPRTSFSLSSGMQNPKMAFRHVILELKFTNRFPNWMTDLVRSFNLRQDSAAKYVDGVNHIGKHRIQHHHF